MLNFSSVLPSRGVATSKSCFAEPIPFHISRPAAFFRRQIISEHDLKFILRNYRWKEQSGIQQPWLPIVNKWDTRYYKTSYMIRQRFTEVQSTLCRDENQNKFQISKRQYL